RRYRHTIESVYF
ncbi:CPXV054 protein, partial [Monkeypox virus]